MAYIPQPKDVTNFLGSNLTPQTYSSEAQFRSPSPPAAQNFMQPSPQMATGMGPSQTQIEPQAASNPVAAGQATPPSPWQSSSGPSMGNMGAMMGGGGIDLQGILKMLMSGGGNPQGTMTGAAGDSSMSPGSPGGAWGMAGGGMDKLKSMWGGNGQPMLRGLFGSAGA